MPVTASQPTETSTCCTACKRSAARMHNAHTATAGATPAGEREGKRRGQRNGSNARTTQGSAIYTTRDGVDRADAGRSVGCTALMHNTEATTARREGTAAEDTGTSAAGNGTGSRACTTRGSAVYTTRDSVYRATNGSRWHAAGRGHGRGGGPRRRAAAARANTAAPRTHDHGGGPNHKPYTGNPLKLRRLLRSRGFHRMRSFTDRERSTKYE